MGFLGIGQVMCKWVNGSLLTFTTNVAITRKRQQPNGWCNCCLRPTMAALVEKRTSKLCVSLVGTLFFHRSGYRWCIEQVICKRVSENLFSHATSAAITRRRQVIYCNSIDLQRAVQMSGSLFCCYQMSSWTHANRRSTPEGAKAQGSHIARLRDFGTQ